MPNTASNVSVGKPAIGGAVYNAPLGTELPANATTELAAGFVSLGYVSDDGFRNTNTPSMDELKAWGGDTVAVLQNEKTDEFQLKLIESQNIDVLKAVYGATNVTGTLSGGITVRANAEEVPASSWVVDMIMTNGVLKRVVIPNAKISDIGEIVYKDDEAIGYDITLKAMPGPESFGYDTHKEFIQTAPAEG